MTDPFFSVVIATRDRPALVALAVDSVMHQEFQDFELILVNDGSSESCLDELDALVQSWEGRIRRVDIRGYPRGHGSSYALNSGVLLARGQFVTFLDDDDTWTDMAHLRKAFEALSVSADADAYYTNQLAIPVGQNSGKLLWLAELENLCQSAGLQRNGHCYVVPVALFLASHGFAHLNCSIVRRTLFLDLKGLDEDIRWENDHEFFLRTIDNARTLLFNPDVVSRHNIPDKRRTNNLTTVITRYQQLGYQLHVMNKVAYMASHASIRSHAMLHLGYTLKKLALLSESEGKLDLAHFYSSQALGMGKSWKWLFKHLHISLRRMLSGGPR